MTVTLQDRDTCVNGHAWNSENIVTLANGSLRCKLCRRTQEVARRKQKALGKTTVTKSLTCRFGHMKSEFWNETQGKCRECLRIYGAHNKKRFQNGLPPVPLVVIMGDYATEGIIMAKKNSLDGFKLTPTQAVVSDEFAYAVADSAEAGTNLRPKCEDNPGPYMDYKENHEPSIVDAMKLCAGCPFVESCQKLAEELKPVAGVWGPGVVWLNGRPRE